MKKILKLVLILLLSEEIIFCMTEGVRENPFLVTSLPHDIQSLIVSYIEGQWIYDARIKDRHAKFTALAAHPIRSIVALGIEDGTVAILNLDTNNKYYLAPLEHFSNQIPINLITFSPNGEYLAAGNEDVSIKLFDLQSEELVTTLKNKTKVTTLLSFSSDGNKLFSNTQSGEFRVWDLLMGICQKKIQANFIYAILLSDSKTFIIKTLFAKLSFWNYETDEISEELGVGWIGCRCREHSFPSFPLVVKYDSKNGLLVMLAYDNSIQIWNINSQKHLRTLNAWYTNYKMDYANFTLSNDFQYLATAGFNKLTFWNVNHGITKIQYIYEPKILDKVKYLIFSPKSKYLIILLNNGAICTFKNQTETLKELIKYKLQNFKISQESRIKNLEKEEASQTLIQTINSRNNRLCKYFDFLLTIQNLIKFGADVNAKDERYDDCANTALMYAINGRDDEAINILLNSPNLDVNAVSGSGETALIFASSLGNIDLVKMLLKKPGININQQSNYGNTALMAAARNCGFFGDTYFVIEELLKFPQIDLDAKDDKGLTALELASPYKAKAKLITQVIEERKQNQKLKKQQKSQEAKKIADEKNNNNSSCSIM